MEMSTKIDAKKQAVYKSVESTSPYKGYPDEEHVIRVFRKKSDKSKKRKASKKKEGCGCE
jgi:hypothetical protein